MTLAALSAVGSRFVSKAKEIIRLTALANEKSTEKRLIPEAIEQF